MSTPSVETVAKVIEEFLRRKYVIRADERQKEMGLSYVEAEVTDISREIAKMLVLVAKVVKEDM